MLQGYLVNFSSIVLGNRVSKFNPLSDHIQRVTHSLNTSPGNTSIKAGMHAFKTPPVPYTNIDLFVFSMTLFFYDACTITFLLLCVSAKGGCC